MTHSLDATGEHEKTRNIDVELVEEPEWSFSLIDCGTGMTLNTIKNYFLKAGASFRNSELWKKSFLDEKGKSQIARTGRFGVGALSAFLIGEKIEVYSRHYTDRTGRGYLYCNGILVGDISKPPNGLLFSQRDQDQTLAMRCPTVLVTDHNAILPLDLARKGLSRKDENLTECLKASISEQLISELFLCPASTPSEIVKWWRSERRMISSHGWNPLVFSSNGFSLLDGNLLNKISPRFFVIQHENPTLVDKQIQDEFSSENCWFALATSLRTSKSDLLSQLRDEGYFKFPHLLPGRYHYPQIPFDETCYLIEEEELDQMFLLSSVPNYIRAMRDSGVRFNVGKSSFYLLNRSTDDETIQDVIHFAKRVLKDDVKKHQRNGPITFLRRFVGLTLSDTPVAKAWNASLAHPYLPYDSAKRRNALLPKAAIGRFL